MSASDLRWYACFLMEKKDASLGLMSWRCPCEKWRSPSRARELPPWQGSPNCSSSKRVRGAATREDRHRVLQGQGRKRRKNRAAWRKTPVVCTVRRCLGMLTSCWAWPPCQSASRSETLPQAPSTSRSCAHSWWNRQRGEREREHDLFCNCICCAVVMWCVRGRDVVLQHAYNLSKIYNL